MDSIAQRTIKNVAIVQKFIVESRLAAATHAYWSDEALLSY